MSGETDVAEQGNMRYKTRGESAREDGIKWISFPAPPFQHSRSHLSSPGLLKIFLKDNDTV